ITRCCGHFPGSVRQGLPRMPLATVTLQPSVPLPAALTTATRRTEIWGDTFEGPVRRETIQVDAMAAV
ncbi:hypothetical protein BaRGS_00021328, partial [Batillaria attramentaria]